MYLFHQPTKKRKLNKNHHSYIGQSLGTVIKTKEKHHFRDLNLQTLDSKYEWDSIRFIAPK